MECRASSVSNYLYVLDERSNSRPPYFYGDSMATAETVCMGCGVKISIGEYQLPYCVKCEMDYTRRPEPMSENGKICEKCGIYRSYDDYYPHGKTKDGFRNVCKICSPQIGKQLRGKPGPKPQAAKLVITINTGNSSVSFSARPPLKFKVSSSANIEVKEE